MRKLTEEHIRFALERFDSKSCCIYEWTNEEFEMLRYMVGTGQVINRFSPYRFEAVGNLRTAIASVYYSKLLGTKILVVTS